MKKILLLGSGALKIGQAGEFDYSGSQAIKAFKEEGLVTILINPNIATVQTSENLADKVYFLPLTTDFIIKVIIKEKPDYLVLSFGGQTALNCGIDLYKKGILKKYKIKVLGTSVDTIIKTEDRDDFANHLKKINVKTPISQAVYSVNDGLKVAKNLGFPVMIRAGYALGGHKSGVVYNEQEFINKAETALNFSKQILVEQYLHHFKEIEYEVVRDDQDNCVTVCNMENFDPLGIHTGESIVVAPSQTLTNFEYHYLRQKSIEIVRSLKIVGECNVQFALNPCPKNTDIDYYVIEVNARLSRSSALASKATGYPLAYVAAKLILGKSLVNIKNQVTQVTQSCFEPALDYLVVKFPRWDIEKFKGAEETIGSSMKSVGEVMAIGRSFEEAIQKAVRMLDIGVQGVTDNGFKDKKTVWHYIKTPTPKRIFAIVAGLNLGFSIEEIYKATGIDRWFLYRLQNIVNLEKEVLNNKHQLFKKLRLLKQLGFSDKKIGLLSNHQEKEIRRMRIKNKIIPSVFSIDTLAGEFPAKTNYLYMTYWGIHHDVKPLDKDGVIVLGSGSYRIGSSVEFDWSSVYTAKYLAKYQKKSIIVNCNPETVSTDYDMSNRLYFEELTLERVLDIYEFEKSYGVIISVGGQTPNNIAKLLDQYGVKILGTKAKDIDQAEDRNKFSKLLDNLNVKQPPWHTFINAKQIKQFIDQVKFPVLIRPSYVLSGSAMFVCYTQQELDKFIGRAITVNKEYPVTVSKFFTEAKEIEVDAVSQDGIVQVMAIAEHIEHAGVHSGDACIVFPSQRLYTQTEEKIKEVTIKISKALNITGPFNIQFLAKNADVYVIEVNLRASRTVPFISKATKTNFIEVFIDSLFKKSTPKIIKRPKSIVVKVPQFSFSRLEGADPILRVEMASTGEVACFGDDIDEAFLKAFLSAGISILPKKGIFISLGGDENKFKFLPSVRLINKMKIPMYATENTGKFLASNGIKTIRLYKIHDKKTPNILDCFQNKKVDLAINIPDVNAIKDIDDDYRIRRSAIDHNIKLITNRQRAERVIKAISNKKINDLLIKSWDEYIL